MSDSSERPSEAAMREAFGAPSAAPEQDRKFHVTLEQGRSGYWTAEIMGPGINFPLIATGETEEECLAEAKQVVEWIKTRPPAKTIEL